MSTHTLPPIGPPETNENKDRKKRRKKRKKTKKCFDERTMHAEDSDSRSECMDPGGHMIQHVTPATVIQMNIPVSSTNVSDVVDSGNENECPRPNSSDRSTK